MMVVSKRIKIMVFNNQLWIPSWQRRPLLSPECNLLPGLGPTAHGASLQLMLRRGKAVSTPAEHAREESRADVWGSGERTEEDRALDAGSAEGVPLHT